MMTKKTYSGVKFISLVLCIPLLLSCQASNTTKGTAIGVGAGGAIGGVIGHAANNTALGAILGAAIGGTAGALIGKHMDKQAADLQVDLKGAKVERVGEGIKITFDSGLMFDFNSYSLTTATKGNLTDLSKTLNKYPDTEILIEGHTDSQGAEDYNMKLSRDRASAVADYLEQQGVKSSRVTTKGYGEDQPVSTVDSENRRVEVAIYANKKMKKLAEQGKLN